jgi:carbon monoxide dehydrogenase subunit G
MKLSGTHTMNAPRERVWTVLNDIEALKTLIPGVESLEEVAPNSYKGVAKVGVAGIKGEYTGTVQLSELQPPESYRISGEGKGKPGHVKGTGTIKLVEDGPNTTTLHYNGDIQVGGMIASVGQRLIEGAAKLLVGQGLKALSQRVERQ